MALTIYTNIPNSDIDPESPVTTSLVTSLRDNPKALSEYLFFSTSDTFTVPITGYYYLWGVGGGQGGDGGEDGNGAGWTSCLIQNHVATKDGSDANSGLLGGNTEFLRGATTLLLAPGGGYNGDAETIYGVGLDFGYASSGQGNATCAAKLNGGAGGNGGSTPFGAGGVGAFTSNGTAGSGKGAGGGGGWVQDGFQLTSYGNGGMSGQWIDTLVALTASESITVNIGAGGPAGSSASHGQGGAGADGWAFLKLWPESANL